MEEITRFIPTLEMDGKEVVLQHIITTLMYGLEIEKSSLA
jgi:hypothetical protein